jgi:MFS family permease
VLLVARTVDECAGFLPAASFASFRSDLGLTYTQASLVLVLGAPGGIVGNVSAVLADHRSRRVIAATGAFGYAGSLFAFAAGHTFAALAVASFTTGFFAHTLINGTELAMIDIAGDKVSAYLARGMLFGTAGGLLGPAFLIATTAAGWGWRGAFAAAGALLVAYAAVLAALPLPPPARVDADRGVVHGFRAIARDGRMWYFGVVALLMGTLEQPFVAFVVAYAHQDRGSSTTVTTVLAAAWIVGVVAATARVSRGRHDRRTMRLHTGAAVVCAGVLAATVVPFTGAIAAGIAACAFGISMLTLTVKSRIVELHPGLVGSAFALVSTIEFAGFFVPIGLGRVADAHGVHVGLACFTAVAFVLLLVASAGDRRDLRRRSGPGAERRPGGSSKVDPAMQGRSSKPHRRGPDRRRTLRGAGGPEVGAA